MDIAQDFEILCYIRIMMQLYLFKYYKKWHKIKSQVHCAHAKGKTNNINTHKIDRDSNATLSTLLLDLMMSPISLHVCFYFL